MWCAIVGEKCVFSVRIDKDNIVDDLKKSIKATIPNRLKNVDAAKLQLFLAKTDDGWLSYDSDDVQKLEQGDTSDLVEALTQESLELRALDPLEDVLRGVDPPGHHQIHVLIAH